MQHIILRVVLLISLFFMSILSQAQVHLLVEKENVKLEKLKIERKAVEVQEKDLLKEAIEMLQEKLKNKEISVVAFEEEKKVLAKKHAENIRSRQLIIDESIAYAERNPEIGIRNMSFIIGSSSYPIGEKSDTIIDEVKALKKKPNHYSRLYLAAGFSNAIGAESLGDSPFKLAGSRFFEIGVNWRTSLSVHGIAHIRYGIGLQYDGFKPTENRYFVMDEDKRLHLEEHDFKLKKSKLRVTNLVIPIHLELSNHGVYRKPGEASVVANSNSWRVGVGGYIGMGLNAKQKLKFRNEEGRRQKVKQTMRDGIYQPVYGLSAYVGKGNVQLYGRYELSPLFKNQDKSDHTLAIGLRFGS